jgi:glycerate 2-kinase
MVWITMRIVIAPDKFKGSLPATGVAAALAAGLRAGMPAAELVMIPVADGGDGTVDAAVAAGFGRVPVTASGPTGEPVRASYALRDGHAIVELASVCGLDRLPGGRLEPMTASSYGMGEVVAAALDAGARQITLAVGGSASTDGGAGMLQALGARVLNANGADLARGGAALRDVARLDLAGLHPALRQAGPHPPVGQVGLCPAAGQTGVRPAVDQVGLHQPMGQAALTVAVDVNSPLLGPHGAAEVFGPQKGASPAQVSDLASGLRRWAAVVAAATGEDLSGRPGTGAAGGVGFAAQAVLGAAARPGTALVLELAGLDAALAGAALVITGEGALDEQSLTGKAPVGVARAAARHRVPVIAVAGRSTLPPGQARAAGFTAVRTLAELEPDPARSIAQASELLRRLGQAIARDMPILSAG